MSHIQHSRKWRCIIVHKTCFPSSCCLSVCAAEEVHVWLWHVARLGTCDWLRLCLPESLPSSAAVDDNTTQTSAGLQAISEILLCLDTNMQCTKDWVNHLVAFCSHLTGFYLSVGFHFILSPVGLDAWSCLLHKSSYLTQSQLFFVHCTWLAFLLHFFSLQLHNSLCLYDISKYFVSIIALFVRSNTVNSMRHLVIRSQHWLQFGLDNWYDWSFHLILSITLKFLKSTVFAIRSKTFLLLASNY